MVSQYIQPRNDVKVDRERDKKDDRKVDVDSQSRIPDFFKRIYASTPGGQLQEARQPGSVKYADTARPILGEIAQGLMPFNLYGPLSSLLPEENLEYGLPGMIRTGRETARGALGGALDWLIGTPPPEAGPAVAQPGGPLQFQQRPESAVEETQPEEAATNWLAEALAMQAQYAPDYSGIAAALQDEGLAINAQIQALYNQLAEGAEQNVAQLEDIYGGARAGVGEAYDIGTGATEQAYQSAQQQAADQLARLGIEQAAPRVIDPMALSQAEAQSALESGRSAGLAGVARSGATAQDFASQMAQVGQMQGADYQRSVADQLRRQLLGLELQAQQDAYQRALQAPGLAQDLYAASQLGQPQGPSFEQELAAKQQALREQQAFEEAAADQQSRIAETYDALRSREGGNLTHEEALAEIELRRQAGVL